MFNIPSSLRDNRVAWIAVVILSLLRFQYSSHMDLLADEAYYWDWSRYLSWGYFDHPPMVAFLAYLSTHIFGGTILGVKIAPLACSILTLAFLILLARRYCRQPSSFIILILVYHSILLTGLGTLLLAPDAPLTLFWALGLFLFYRAVFEPFSGVWTLLGIVGGLGLLSKYTFALFFLSALLFLLVDKSRRRLLLSIKPWWSVFLAFITFLPNILWNIEHHWISVAFQLNHGLKSSEWLNPDLFLRYITGQIIIITPLCYALLVIACWQIVRKYRSDSRLTLLLVFFAVPIVTFALSSLQKKVEANWTAGAYVSGLILIAWLWDFATEISAKALRRFIIVAIATAAICTVTVMVHIRWPILPLPPDKDMTAQIRGWQTFGVDLRKSVDAIDPEHRLPLTSNKYQDTALMSFYTPQQPRMLALNFFDRPNEYSLLKENARWDGQQVLYVVPLGESDLDERLHHGFEEFTMRDVVYLHRNGLPDKPFGVFFAKLRHG